MIRGLFYMGLRLHEIVIAKLGYSVCLNATLVYTEKKSAGVLHKHSTIQNLGREIRQQQGRSAEKFHHFIAASTVT
jgi:hypothetical protein